MYIRVCVCVCVWCVCVCTVSFSQSRSVISLTSVIIKSNLDMTRNRLKEKKEDLPIMNNNNVYTNTLLSVFMRVYISMTIYNLTIKLL